MPTEVIPVGPPFSAVQSSVYALPARAGRIHCTAAIEISPDQTTWDFLTNADSVGADVTSGFVRCTTSTNAVLVFRPY